MKLKNLFILVGAPGSGKSYWATKRIKEIDKGNAMHISRDKVRFALISEDEEYFSREPIVYKTWIAAIQAAIDSKAANTDNIYVDATNLSVARRKELFENIDLPNRKNNVNINIVYFCTDVITCMKRNANREGRENVPNMVIRRMYNSIEIPKEDELMGTLGIKYTNIYEVLPIEPVKEE